MNSKKKQLNKTNNKTTKQNKYMRKETTNVATQYNQKLNTYFKLKVDHQYRHRSVRLQRPTNRASALDALPSAQ